MHTLSLITAAVTTALILGSATTAMSADQPEPLGYGQNAKDWKSAIEALQRFATIYGRDEESKRAVADAYNNANMGNGKYIATRIDYYQEKGTGYWKSTSNIVGEGLSSTQAVDDAIFNDHLLGRPNGDYTFRSSAILVGRKTNEGTEMTSVSYSEVNAKIKEREAEERKIFEENAARAEAKLKLDAESKKKLQTKP